MTVKPTTIDDPMRIGYAMATGRTLIINGEEVEDVVPVLIRHKRIGSKRCKLCQAYLELGTQFCHKCGFNQKEYLEEHDDSEDESTTEANYKLKGVGGCILTVVFILLMIGVYLFIF